MGQPLQPWWRGSCLRSLLAVYAQTEYGAQHRAGQIGSLEDYRRAFPVMSYENYKPLIQQVMAGETRLLLNEEPVGWAITRGTTGDERKFIPMTPADLRLRVQAGRAMMAYVATSRRYDLFQGVNLNLNFPSVVGVLKVGERELTYGYSSGIYTKFVSHRTPIPSLPTQEDIDALGGGSILRDWETHWPTASVGAERGVSGGCGAYRLAFRPLPAQTLSPSAPGPLTNPGDDPRQRPRDQYPPFTRPA